MAFSTYNSFQRNLTIINNIYEYIFAVDASLVLFYPFDTKTTSTSKNTPNYASSKAVYDATLIGNSQITTTSITGIADLSLNNTMASYISTDYVVNTTQTNLVPSTGLSISVWFSCTNATLQDNTTICSLIFNNSVNGVELGLTTNNNIYSNLFLNNSTSNIITLLSSFPVYFPLTYNFNNYGTSYITTKPVPNSNAKISSNIAGFNCLFMGYGNGLEGYITNRFDFVNNPNITIGFWFYDNNGGTYFPFSIFKSDLTNFEFCFQSVNSVNFGAYQNWSNYRFMSSYNTNYAAKWTHIAWTLSSVSPYNYNFYVNGNLVTTSGINYGGPFTGGSDSICIGSNFGFSGAVYGICHAFVANRILTSTEIMNIKNGTNALNI